jgi:TPR repeat protein
MHGRVALLALVAAVLSAALYFGLQREPPAPAAPVSTTHDESRTAAAAERGRASTPDASRHDTPVASMQSERRPAALATPASATAPEDFATRLERLERAALTGDADAAAELGDLLSLCREYAPMSAQAIEDSIVTGAAANEPLPSIGGKPVTPEFLILLLRQGYAELDRHCAGSERVVDATRARAAPDWLQRAADAGRVEAMTSYAHHVLVQQANDPEDAGTDARRARALDYLEGAVRAGDARALQLRSDAQTHGYGLPADPIGAYTDLYVFARTALGRSWPPRLIELYLQALAQPLDAAQLAEAQRRGEALWRDCCARGSP